jgi:Asp-tRNA(Asn)/Glu-tRNA(Gln) amidotransferase A subunit family amidase
MSVPAGLAANGVPIGVQVVGRPYHDPTVFDVAGALEVALGWWSSPGWRPSGLPAR